MRLAFRKPRRSREELEQQAGAELEAAVADGMPPTDERYWGLQPGGAWEAPAAPGEPETGLGGTDDEPGSDLADQPAEWAGARSRNT